MKPFKDMSTIDKGKLLHVLFPDDINHLLTFIVDSADMILTDANLMPDNWNRKIALSEWMEKAQAIKQIIIDHREQMVKDSDCFSNTLFKGYLDFFPIQCIIDHTLLSPNQKLADAIQFLFEL